MVKVRVFSTPICPYCTMTKNFLKEHNIDFEDIDVSEDRKQAEYMIEKTGQMGVPVVEIDDEFIIGFDRERIKEKLKIK